VTKQARGFVLLEALVALLIFSLGVLGMVGFQAASTKIATDSRFRTEAALLADELMAKMATSDLSTVRSDYAQGGAKFKAWYKDRVLGGSYLPNATVTIDWSPPSYTSQTLVAVLTIEWTNPGVVDKNAKASEVKGSYTTTAMLF